MNQEILDYIKSQRVGVLAVEMLDGSPHGSTVHFANTEDPLQFFFETTQNYKKAQPILSKEAVRASFVIGSDESNMKTLQLDGIIHLITDAERQKFYDIYFEKFPEKIGKSYGAEQIYFVLIPKWWRFTDWTKPKGKVIFTSENN